MLDEHLTMQAHVSSLIKSVNYELRRISSIRHYLTTQATQTLVCSFVLSRLDYCNALLAGCPDTLLARLQKLQNNAARLVLKIPKTDHITPHLRNLHWLPIKDRIKYKIACLTFGAVNSTGPQYLSDLVSVYTPSRSLRSQSDASTLCVPRIRAKTFGQRSFSFNAPSIWNGLPFNLRSIESVQSFRNNLKFHLFNTQ